MLNNLIKVITNKKYKNHFVRDIVDDSRYVKNNDIFVCIKGYTFDGHDFIHEAIKNGCKTIICETKIKDYDGINVIKVSNTKKAFALLLKKFNKRYLKNIKIIAITGTSGKTTTSSIISEGLNYKGIKNILISSNGIKINNEITNTFNTTPHIKIIYECIKRAKKEKIKYIILETSSQAIKELRCYYLDIYFGIFLNLYKEHLDYHKTIDDYFYTKLLFLKNCKYKAINKDSSYYNLINNYIDNFITFSINSNSDIKGMIINKTLENGINIKMKYNDNKYMLKTFLIGDFNVYNILASFSFLKSLLTINEFIEFIKLYTKTDGRMNYIRIKNIDFLIDFAHTSNEVYSVLKEVKEYSFKRIILITGCGGNRDILKRSEIGRISTSLADYVIFTNDNPRNELETEIMKDIISGIRNNNYEIIYDRYLAIKRAINLSTDKEIIVILGKGSENYQIINNIKMPFNDLEVIKKIMEEK